MSASQSYNNEPDVLLIGAGIMSATLAMLLKQLQPSWTIEIVERLDAAAQESSDAWNNAGTGHSAFCELNYTPEKADSSIDIAKAVKIAASFEESKQFWSYLVEKGTIQPPSSFIRSIPHMSFVWGEKKCFLPAQAPRSPYRLSLVQRHAVLHRSRTDPTVDTTDHGRPNTERTGGCHTDGPWHRCQFWFAHPLHV